MIKTTQIKIKTEEHELFIDITSRIKDIVKQTKIKNGQIIIYTRHTTMGIKIMETEALLLNDFKNFLFRLAPKNGIYYHNEVEKRQVPDNERLNAHSHIWSLFINTSETIPIIDGKMCLGKWQNIVLVECDAGRDREIIIQVIGE